MRITRRHFVLWIVAGSHPLLAQDDGCILSQGKSNLPEEESHTIHGDEEQAGPGILPTLFDNSDYFNFASMLRFSHIVGDVISDGTVSPIVPSLQMIPKSASCEYCDFMQMCPTNEEPFSLVQPCIWTNESSQEQRSQFDHLGNVALQPKAKDVFDKREVSGQDTDSETTSNLTSHVGLITELYFQKSDEQKLPQANPSSEATYESKHNASEGVDFDLKSGEQIVREDGKILTNVTQTSTPTTATKEKDDFAANKTKETMAFDANKTETGNQGGKITRTKEDERPHRKDGGASSEKQLKVDYASKSAGALIMEKSSSFRGTGNLLTADRDKYALAPCEDDKFVAISLSEEILVKQVMFVNYERFSSTPKKFELLGSQTIDGDWVYLGTYSASKPSGAQVFDLTEPSWARYLKFHFLTHYGDEYYCTVTQIMVHGDTVLQGFHDQWKESEEETQKILQHVESSRNVAADDYAAGTNGVANASAVRNDSNANLDENDVTHQSTEAVKADDHHETQIIERTKNNGSVHLKNNPSVRKRSIDKYAAVGGGQETTINGVAESLVKSRPLYLNDSPTQHSSWELNNSKPNCFTNCNVDGGKKCHNYAPLEFPLADSRVESVLQNLSIRLATTNYNTNGTPPSFANRQRSHSLKKMISAITASPDSEIYLQHRRSPISVADETVKEKASANLTDRLINFLYNSTNNVDPADENKETQTESTKDHKQSDSTRSDDELHDVNATLAYFLDRHSNVECIQTLNYTYFKANILSKGVSLSNGLGSGSGNAAAQQASGAMEPIFKKLTDEIKSLQIILSVHDQFTKEAVSCYQQVLLDMFVELGAMKQNHELRISKLEEQLHQDHNSMPSELILTAYNTWDSLFNICQVSSSLALSSMLSFLSLLLSSLFQLLSSLRQLLSSSKSALVATLQSWKLLTLDYCQQLLSSFVQLFSSSLSALFAILQSWKLLTLDYCQQLEQQATNLWNYWRKASIIWGKYRIMMLVHVRRFMESSIIVVRALACLVAMYALLIIGRACLKEFARKRRLQRNSSGRSNNVSNRSSREEVNMSKEKQRCEKDSFGGLTSLERITTTTERYPKGNFERKEEPKLLETYEKDDSTSTTFGPDLCGDSTKSCNGEQNKDKKQHALLPPLVAISINASCEKVSRKRLAVDPPGRDPTTTRAPALKSVLVMVNSDN